MHRITTGGHLVTAWKSAELRMLSKRLSAESALHVVEPEVEYTAQRSERLLFVASRRPGGTARLPGMFQSLLY